MIPLSIEDACKIFLASDAKYISQEQSSIYYDNFSGQIDLSPYFTHDCLVVRTGIDWHIHALSAEADILAAIGAVKNACDSNSRNLMVCTWSDIPEELKGKMGAYKFARNYMPYHDNAIRALTIKDTKNIEICCSPDPGDNQIGKNISKEFLNHYKDFLTDPHVTNLGLFINDQLTGFVQAFSQKGLGLSTINIFVNRAYRKNGYAKRLLSAICATSPGNVYCYSCVKTNIASVHTAQTCGFELKGAYLFI